MSPPRKTVGMVSLGCAKALVDSERILTRLKAQGYDAVGAYGEADAVVVNTCAFLDSARQESLDAIDEAQASGRPVVVTGCLGGEAALLRAKFPGLSAITRAHRYDEVVEAVRQAAPPPPPAPDAPTEALAAARVPLTPRHYAYLKISEGCNHRCAFCIIPALRGRLASRPIGEVLTEAEALVASGVKELLVVAQDTSAYGLDLRHAASEWRGRSWRADLEGLARGLAELQAWVRLHYVYPYPHVDAVVPIMAEGGILPYLDMPFQHASPKILRAMRRPADEAKVLERLAAWRRICPDLAVRSTFVVGFPGETEADFAHLLSWLEEAQLDRVGCFAYENVAGAAAQALPDHVPEAVKQERRTRLLALAARISREKLKARVGRTLEVLVDEAGADGVAVARSKADAPDVDGRVFVSPGRGLRPGDRLKVRVERSDAFDLYASPCDLRLRAPRLQAAGRTHALIRRR